MNVKINKLNVKLTPSIVSQILTATFEQLQEGNVIGFFIYKNIRYMLLDTKYGLRKIGIGWHALGDTKILGFKNLVSHFKDKASRDQWLEAYDKCVEKATEQIFI